MLTLVALSLTWAIEVIKRIRSRSLKKIRFTYFNKKKKKVGLILGFAAKMSRDFALLRQQASFISDHRSTHNQGFG